ncbi:ABC transporter permease [Streptomyces spongiae]|uniref:ABC transporter permease n=1 Tax=Streptomyces spongiae TaxID=565072 RepID=A0A5N8XQA0_9ACTN|nr:ABC transporter permease [Streptomyces spongiae]MPY61356.1 ABC transporter permease [Streptomyces spongiae]
MVVPTSGATVPLQALPGLHRALGEFQPLRQITGVVRSILYYDAQGDAGLPRGWVILGLGLAVACLFGFGVTRFYDRKRLHRDPADKEPQQVLARTQTDDP